MAGRREMKVDAARLDDALKRACQWGRTLDGGMCRLAASIEDREARLWFIEETNKFGCEHKVDELGNIFAIRAGQDNKLPPIALGSHLDTQPTGGRFDGILGICCALEVLKVIHDNELETYAPLMIVNWTNEEGARFSPSMLGSGTWAGEFSPEFALNRTDASGKRLGEELNNIGFSGRHPCSYLSNPLLAHLEVHIEQGPILDSRKEPVAIVQGVNAICWFDIQIEGTEGHTGTTPMDCRKDALLGAAQMITIANTLVTTTESMQLGKRATIAVVNSSPQAINTISGRVQLNLDIRCPTDEGLEDLERSCREEFGKIAASLGLVLTFEKIFASPSLAFDETVTACIRASANISGCRTELTSGAGHDSVYTAKRCPSGMIFVRSKDGVSHNPREYSRPEDCATGAQVLLDAYLRMDEWARRLQHDGTVLSSSLRVDTYTGLVGKAACYEKP